MGHPPADHSSHLGLSVLHAVPQNLRHHCQTVAQDSAGKSQPGTLELAGPPRLPPRCTGRLLLFLVLDVDQLWMIQGTGRHPKA